MNVLNLIFIFKNFNKCSNLSIKYNLADRSKIIKSIKKLLVNMRPFQICYIYDDLKWFIMISLLVAKHNLLKSFTGNWPTLSKWSSICSWLSKLFGCWKVSQDIQIVLNFVWLWVHYKIVSQIFNNCIFCHLPEFPQCPVHWH